MNTIKEAEDFFYGFQNHVWDLGLDNLKAFMGRLGHPENQCKVIHVAGTNGKGSVSSFLYEILICAGFKVGRYHSPVVFKKRENIAINGVAMSDSEYIDLIKELRQPLEAADREGVLPTIFEMETALAYLYFARNKCDFCVIECGLGGENDATNITESTILSVLTSISLDHTAYLGDTLQKIAGCKAGIIKSKVPCVALKQNVDVLDVVRQRTESLDSQLTVVDPAEREELITTDDKLWSGQSFSYKGQTYRMQVMGKYQYDNAVLAIEAAKILESKGIKIAQTAIGEGIQAMKLPGRFEILRRERPLLIIDGAHNPDAALRLRENVETFLQGYRVIYIMGMFADKNYKKVVENTCDLADNIYTVRAEGERGLDADVLAKCIRDYGYRAEAVHFVKEALKRAKRQARVWMNQGDEKVAILCFGSLSYLKYVKQEVEENDNW